MKVDWEQNKEPTPEMLAAYFDGELTHGERANVDAWLAAHPEGRAELESLRRLHALYEAAPVPEPTAQKWDETLTAIEVEVRRRRPQRPWNLAWLGLVGGLAAALAGLLLLRPEVVHVREVVEPFPVIEARDVHIISMNPNDREVLVVAEPLELLEINLANHNDVDILGGEKDGMMRIDDWASPMIVDPLAYGGPR